MASTSVTLGDFEFADFELPERLPFGGAQQHVLHKLIGGARVADALGRDDRALEWSGRFRGPDAMNRVRQVDAMRTAGKPVAFACGELAYTVLVAEFLPELEKLTEIPFSIRLVIITDDAAPLSADAGPGVDEMVGGDLTDATDLTAGIGDATLSGLMSGVTSAVAGVTQIATATTSQLAGLLTPITAAQAQVAGLIDAVDATIGQVSQIGGVVAGGNPLTMAGSLLGELSAMDQASSLYDLQSTLGRMATNIRSVGASGADVVMAGGDLFHLAAVAYGDVSAWATIAAANGLVDPVIAGLTTIRVPPAAGDTGGVLDP